MSGENVENASVMSQKEEAEEVEQEVVNVEEVTRELVERLKAGCRWCSGWASAQITLTFRSTRAQKS